MLYIYLNYTENGSSYLTENRNFWNYEENSKFMEEKITLNSHNGMKANKNESIMQNFRTLYQAVNMFTIEP